MWVSFPLFLVYLKKATLYKAKQNLKKYWSSNLPFARLLFALEIEFWEDHFKCRYPNSSLTPYNKDYLTPCTTKEELNKNNTDFEDQLQFVSDAVMAFAYALR